MEVKITGLNEALAQFGRTRDQLPFAISLAINKTAQSIKKAEQEEMTKVFDRPTPFTLNSIQIDPSNKDTLTATIRIRDAANLGEKHYLIPEVRGGYRPLKRYEVLLNKEGYLPDGMYTVPAAGSRLDSYGNMSPGQIVQILSYLRAFPEQGYLANRTARSLQKNKAPRDYFLMRDAGGVAKGIYQRMPGNQFPMPVLIFVAQPRYQRRFDFYGVARSTAEATFRQNMINALVETIRTAKFK